MDKFMIFFAKDVIYLIIVIVAVYVLFQKRARQKSLAFVSVISLPLAFIIAKIAGHLYKDPRPFVTQHITPLIPHDVSNGFPSDHALLGFTLAAIIFMFNKPLGVALGVLTLLVGIGRIYVHVHSPVDILGSFVIAVAAVSAAWYLRKNFIRI